MSEILYICKSCEGVYLIPVTQCDCMPENQEFTEMVMVEPEEIERLRSEVAELKQSLGLPDEITAEPADNYDDLRKQFNALKSVANGKCRMASHWSRLVDKLTRDAMLSSNGALSSERETNAMLTDALEKAEAERDRLRDRVARFERLAKAQLEAHSMSAVDYAAMRELEMLVEEA